MTTPRPAGQLVAEFPSAASIAAAVRSGERRASEVIEQSLARIAEVNPVLNCFTAVLADEARAAAAAVDATPPAERGPLAGVPIGIKAEIDIEGVVTSFGGRGNSTPARADAEVVRRLRAAGAVIVGTTAMPEFGQFPFTESVAYGVTRNPWDTSRSTGGSSGGTAAAIASGCVPVAIGGDGGGSIRIPASCCGLVGLKPARGRVSTSPYPSFWGSLGTTGPLARTAEDSALVYDVVRGSLPSDRVQTRDPAQSYAASVAEAPRALRIGWLTGPALALGPVRVDRQVVAAVEATARRLRELGHEVVPLDGRWPDVQQSFVPQFLAAIREEAGMVEHPERLEHRTRTTARMGLAVGARGRRRAERLGERARRDFMERFAGLDAVLTPTIACLPPRLGQLDATGTMHALVRSLPMIAFTSLANVTGLPAVSVPAGTSTEGWPIGVQLSGLTDDEGVLFALAGQLGRS